MDTHIILVPNEQSYIEGSTLETLHNVFLDCVSESTWVIGFEYGDKSKKWHYHATVYGHIMTRETLRARLNKSFSLSKKRLSLTDIHNPQTVISYTIKGGNFMSYGIDEELINKSLENSYEKNQNIKEHKKDFRKLLKEIEDEYLKDTGPYQLEDFVEKYLQAYLDYGKPIYLSHIKARLITIRLRKSPERLKGYVRGILDDLGLGNVSREFMEVGKSYPQL